ncbi:NAD(P)/FAD-dependent oxidoreductase [Priestia megaterium]|uniref:NAD(P)/FAD-dependent oxidoreductase n=1 Tax=Priestia megaterium TaxID=1404 RepID=UPI0020B2FF2B|nr:NAD(P)/FAD-dependent oxidoreductase [Priestia megaterium]
MQRKMVQHFIDMGCLYEVNTKVLSIEERSKKVKVKQQEKEKEICYTYLILATGSSQRKLGVPGEQQMIDRGDRAFEGAHLLASKAKDVYLIHGSTHFKAREQYVEKVLSDPDVKVMTDTEVTAIHGKHHVTSIDLKSKNKECENLLVDAVLIRLGVAPNVELIKEKVTLHKAGSSSSVKCIKAATHIFTQLETRARLPCFLVSALQPVKERL